MYLLRTAIPKKVKVLKGLKCIYGVGNFISKIELKAIGLLDGCYMRDLRNSHKRLLKSKFSNTPPLAARLQAYNKSRCQRLINIQSYSGRRHKFGYPVRGQRTHTNARTQKKLHRRWLFQDIKRPKTQVFVKKFSSQKTKKPKVVAKQKDKNKKKAPTQKVGKYKIS